MLVYEISPSRSNFVNLTEQKKIWYYQSQTSGLRLEVPFFMNLDTPSKKKKSQKMTPYNFKISLKCFLCAKLACFTDFVGDQV